jgi:hypothetical protein
MNLITRQRLSRLGKRKAFLGRRKWRGDVKPPATACAKTSSGKASHRGAVQLCRRAAGVSSDGVATRSAASALSGTGPGAGLVLSDSVLSARRCREQVAAPQPLCIRATAEGFCSTR